MLKKRRHRSCTFHILEQVKADKKKMVYISGALTGLTAESSMKEFYERIAETTDKVCGIGTAYVPHMNTDPIKHPDVTPEEVYQLDRQKVYASNLVIAYMGEPSFGVGAELQMANEKGIPILLLYEKGKGVSRLPRGMESVKGICEYSTEDEALQWVERELKKILLV